MADRKWTAPQWDAVTARGGQVLVSAAAGSGKTAVLVERAVRLLCDPDDPTDADRLLIVTFSRAAAAEMKQRMGARLAEMIRENPADVRLQRQQALLAGAAICTVDAFCLELVRQNFQDLEVSPDFTIADQSELAILESDCVGSCIEAFYERGDNGVFLELVELLSTARDDRRLAETVLQIYRFSRSHPFFQDWLDDKLRLYEGGVPPGRTPWGEAVLAHARDRLEHCIALAEHAAVDLAADEKMEAAYGPAFASDLLQMRRCLQAAAAADWDGAVAAVRAYAPQKLGRLTGDDPRKERAKAVRDRVKKTLRDLAEKYLCASEAEFAEDLLDLRPKIQVLFEMVGDFHARLTAAKAERRCLDFADLEHLALHLLVERDEQGCRPTRKAAEVAARYDYVLVDEYQDTNEVQDLLFTSLSRAQRNLFVVGDVKQSIYGFRQAMPEIFMEKKRRFYPYAGGEGLYPAKILLDHNFRSRSQVTGAVNFLFSRLMSEELGDVRYDEAESLKCGAAYTPYDRAQPELLLVDASGEDAGDPVEAEAAAIAGRIRHMLDTGYKVEDGGSLRPATLRDFCILLRSPKGRAETFVQVLGRHGIAAGADATAGFLTAREVAAVVSLLRALDNPLLDIELAAALLSPLFDFDADDLARVRLAARGAPLHQALVASARAGDAGAEAFLTQFRRWRSLAALLPADRLLLRIYADTHAPTVFAAMPMGHSRRANLQLLLEYAADYHARGYRQLGGFVGFLGRLAERGGDLAPAAGAGDTADVVRIMSIHRSKGLEFPVVFLADTAHQFNKTDLRQNTLLHARFGFACVRRDHETMKQYPTVPLQAIRLQSHRSLLSEEMRILYVALTRAREKLIVVGALKTDPAKKLAGLHAPLRDGALPPSAVGEGGCYLDWVLAALLHHADAGGLRALAPEEAPDLLDDGNPWRVTVVPAAAEAPAAGQAGEEEAPPAAPDEALLALLRSRAAWRYPHLDETRTPAKLSVSAVAKGEVDAAYRFRARPRFLSSRSLTPAERGNALHKFMQFANYARARDSLEEEIARMGDEGFLSPAEVESLKPEKLRKFFHSPLAGRIFASEKVYRELKFMAECGHDMLGDAVEMAQDSAIVLQGVADCVFVEGGGAVIVDYKTDAVAAAAELRARYTRQLELYRDILGRSLGIPVLECILYSFHLSREVKI